MGNLATGWYAAAGRSTGVVVAYYDGRLPLAWSVPHGGGQYNSRRYRVAVPLQWTTDTNQPTPPVYYACGTITRKEPKRCE